MVFTERQKNELRNLTNDIARDVVKNAILDQGFLNALIDKISERVSHKMNDALENFTAKIESLELRVNSLVCENEQLKLRMDELEQQGQLNKLRILGLPENNKNNPVELSVQVTQMFETKLGLKDIVPLHSYRVGSYTKNKQRATLVVFSGMEQRNAVFQNKKKLKGCKMGIVEELTKQRHGLLLLAKEKLGRDMVWSMGGNIYAKVGDKKLQLKTEDDVANLDM